MRKELGQMGYEAYGAYTGNKTYNGLDMPTWDNLGERIQGAWNAAAEVIAAEARRNALMPGKGD